MKSVRPYVPKRQRQSETKSADAQNSASATSGESHSQKGDETSKTASSEISKNTIGCNSSYAECADGSIFPMKNFIPKTCISKTSFHKNAVNCVQWGNNSSSSLLLSASMDSKVVIWSAAKGNAQMVQEMNVHGSAVKDARWSSNGLNILSGGYDKTARITDAETGKQISCYNHKDFVTALLYHPENTNVFLSGTSRCGIFAWDSRTDKYIHEYKSFFGQIQDILFNPDGKTFFSAAEILKRNSLDKAIIAWDFETTAILSNQISQEAFGCTCLQNHPTDAVFLAQYGSGYITIYSNVSPYKLNKYKRFEGHQTAGFRIGFTISPDGNYVITGDRDGQIHAYDYRTSKCVKIFNAYTSACMDVAFHPNLPSLMATCSWDGEVSFWR